MLVIVIALNFILYLLLLLKGSHSNTNSILSHDNELNYVDASSSNSLSNKNNDHKPIDNMRRQSDLTDKAKLLLIEESSMHAKAFNFESYDLDHLHSQQPQPPPPPPPSLLQPKQQQQRSDSKKSNTNIRFIHHRRLDKHVINKSESQRTNITKMNNKRRNKKKVIQSHG